MSVRYNGKMRFRCQQGCTTCCKNKGFVYLTESDTASIAKFLGVSIASFEQQRVYRTKHLLRLRMLRGSKCPFLGAQGCSIHPVKPTQCRLFPFWPELLDDKKEWIKTAEWCPGIGKGPVVQREVAREQAQEMIVAYPRTYGR